MANVRNRKIKRTSQVCGPDAVTVATLPKLIYLFRATLTEFPDGFFLTTAKLTWKFTWKCKGSEDPRVFRKNRVGRVLLPIFKPQHNPQERRQSVTNMNRHIDPQNTTGSPEINPHICGHLIADKGHQTFNGRRNSVFKGRCRDPGLSMLREKGVGPLPDTTLTSAQDGHGPERFELKPGRS